MKKLLISLILVIGLTTPAIAGEEENKVWESMMLSYQIGCLKTLHILAEADMIDIKMSGDEVNGFCINTAQEFIKEFLEDLRKGN